MRTILNIGLIFLITVPLFAQSKNSNRNLKLYISIDRINFSTDESLKLKLVVRNISTKISSFVVYDPSSESEDYITFQPVVTDMYGREAELIVPHRMKGKKIKDYVKGLSKRTVKLYPNEEFVHYVNLRSVYRLNPEINYRVKGFFYGSVENKNPIRSSNECKFKIHEDRQYISNFKIKKVDSATIVPKDIVFLALGAEKSGDWTQFSRFYNFKKFINSYPDFMKRYSSVANFSKMKIMEKFKEFLYRKRSDYILDYKIESEKIYNNEKSATVAVIVRRYGVRADYKYRYRYRLEKNGNYWYIVSIDASILRDR